MDFPATTPSNLLSPVVFMSAISTLLSYSVVCPFVTPYFMKSYSSWTTSKKNYWNTLPCAIIHSVVIVFLSIWALLGVDFTVPLEHQIIYHSYAGKIGMQFSLGYFVGDFIALLSDKDLRTDRMMLFHHISGFVSVGLGSVYSGCYSILILLRLTSELSTPFVNMRWVLAELKIPKTSKIYVANGLSMTATFFCSRIFTIPLLWYILYHFVVYEPPPGVPLPLKYLTLSVYAVFDVLNVYWSYKIAMGCKKHFMPEVGKAVRSLKQQKDN